MSFETGVVIAMAIGIAGGAVLTGDQTRCWGNGDTGIIRNIDYG